MSFNIHFHRRTFPALTCFLSVICFSAVIPGCSQSSTKPPEAAQPALSFIQHSDCQLAPAPKSDVTARGFESCIDYQFDGVGKLELTYRGAYLNCCLDDLTSEISFTNPLISIVVQEHLEGPGCRCNCQYNLDYEVENLPPGNYAIHIEARRDSDAPNRFDYYTLDFEVELPPEPVSETLCTEPEFH